MINIAVKDVLRYLGYGQNTADQRILEKINQLNDEVAGIILPKSVFKIFDCQVDEKSVTFGGFTIHSTHLARHLNGCAKLALFAVTLGAKVDTLIRRYSVNEMDKAVIADAVCTAMTEAFCNKVVAEIQAQDELFNLQAINRFSPGFGDFSITHQRDVLALLDCEKRIGLTLTDSDMLCPNKSVTAIIGFRSGA
ncbi:MAG: Vitamin B12 dependent methionine synthase activation subunit [Oscillospiraceae bacterium]|nr:Vitamin B12 dependent methionine synthase activation subunit [Oscillospiraceae bacterium]